MTEYPSYELLSEQDKQFVQQLLEAVCRPIEDPAPTSRLMCGFQPNPTPETEQEDDTDTQDNNDN